MKIKLFKYYKMLSTQNLIKFINKCPDNKSIVSSTNNNRCVNFLIENPEYIEKCDFNLNTNDNAVKFLITNPQYIDRHFSSNTNDMAVNFLINNNEYMNKPRFVENTNHLAVKYVNDNRLFFNDYLQEYNEVNININNNKIFDLITKSN